MKKFFLFGLVLIIAATAVFAENIFQPVHAVDASGSPVTGYNVYAFNCLDNYRSCENDEHRTPFTGNIIGAIPNTDGSFTVTNSIFIIEFPDELPERAVGVPETDLTGYAFFLAPANEEYHVKAFTSNIHRGTFVGPHTFESHEATFNKQAICTAPIQEVRVVNINEAQVNLPLRVNVGARVDNFIESPFVTNEGLGFYPPEMQGYYQASAQLVFNVVNDEGVIVASVTEPIELVAGTETPRTFEWTPVVAGRHTIIVYSQVTDNVCELSPREEARQELTVYPEGPFEDMCYSNLNDLRVTNAFARQGDTITGTYTVLSNHVGSQGVLNPVETVVDARITLPSGTVTPLFVEEIVEPSNDAQTPLQRPFSFVASETGLYTITLRARADDAVCAVIPEVRTASTTVIVSREEGNSDPLAFSATFTVTNDRGEIVDLATILISGREVITDANGQATIQNLVNGVHEFTISKEGSQVVTGTVTINDADLALPVILTRSLPTFDVNFIIINDQKGREPGVTIEVGGIPVQTSAQGLATVSIVNGVYEFTISKEGFKIVTGIVTVDSADQEIVVQLIRAFTANFVITDENTGNSIEGASVSLNTGVIATTNPRGLATISGLPNGVYTFTITRQSYQSTSGTISIQDDDITIRKSLRVGTGIEDPRFSALFNVMSASGENLANARISLNNGQFLASTDVTGGATITSIPVGTFNYRVTKEGFDLMQGSITIVDANVEERVVLTPGTIDNGGIESDTRKDFDIVITSIRIPYGYVSRGSLIEMSITIENTGRRSLRDIDMSAILLSNNAQGFVAPFDLRPGEQVSKRLYVMLPSHTRLGNDYVLFTIGNEDRQRVLYRGVTIR